MVRQFSFSPNGAPTRHLFIGNCGPNVNLGTEQVSGLFASFGPVEVESVEEAKSYTIVTLHDIQSAEAAMKHFTEVDTSRGFVLKYTTINTRNQPEPVVLYRDAEECAIAGLQLIEDFISEEEEAMLLRYVQDDASGIKWETRTERGVAHFGVAFDYATLNIAETQDTPPFPEPLLPIVNRIEQYPDVPKLDQLTVNSYAPGIGLAAHIDSHIAFTGSIVSLSTGSAAVMLFRKEALRKRLVLPRRSLLILSGEARYCWQHSLPPNRMERGDCNRVSFTMRRARGFPCDCPYALYCDSQDGGKPPTRWLLRRQQREAEETAANEEKECASLEEKHVHDVYDTIARHFSSTRFAVWPKVRGFLQSLPPRAMVADVGCGNGKYFNVRKDLIIVGFDRSERLLEAAMDRHKSAGYLSERQSIADVVVADGLRIPLRDMSVDAVLCIAVLHHVSSIDRRLAFLHEIVRVLRPNGQALVTVWAQEQEDPEKTIVKWQPIEARDNADYIQEITGGRHGGDYFVPWHLPLHRVEGQIAAQKLTEESSGGTLNEEKRSVMFHRYCHLYVKGELDCLCQWLPNVKIANTFYDKSNWCVILQRSL